MTKARRPNFQRPGITYAIIRNAELAPIQIGGKPVAMENPQIEITFTNYFLGMAPLFLERDLENAELWPNFDLMLDIGVSSVSCYFERYAEQEIARAPELREAEQALQAAHRACAAFDDLESAHYSALPGYTELNESVKKLQSGIISLEKRPRRSATDETGLETMRGVLDQKKQELRNLQAKYPFTHSDPETAQAAFRQRDEGKARVETVRSELNGFENRKKLVGRYLETRGYGRLPQNLKDAIAGRRLVPYEFGRNAATDSYGTPLVDGEACTDRLRHPWRSVETGMKPENVNRDVSSEHGYFAYCQFEEGDKKSFNMGWIAVGRRSAAKKRTDETDGSDGDAGWIVFIPQIEWFKAMKTADILRSQVIPNPDPTQAEGPWVNVLVQQMKDCYPDPSHTNIPPQEKPRWVDEPAATTANQPAAALPS